MFLLFAFSSHHLIHHPAENIEDHEGDSPEATELVSKQFQAQNPDPLTASLL